MPLQVSREELADSISDLVACHPGTAFIAIDGLGASGKTYLTQWLVSKLDAVRVCSDDFSRPGAPQWEWERFREQVLAPLSRGEAARYQRYDWEADRLAAWHQIESSGVVIAEGVSISRVELGDPWDVKVWVECPYEIRLARGIARDGEDIWTTGANEWMPEEDAYVVAQRPQERADYIVLGY